MTVAPPSSLLVAKSSAPPPLLLRRQKQSLLQPGGGANIYTTRALSTERHGPSRGRDGQTSTTDTGGDRQEVEGGASPAVRDFDLRSLVWNEETRKLTSDHFWGKYSVKW